MNRTVFTLILSAAVLLTAAAPLTAGTITMDLGDVLASASPEDRIPVIVSLKDKVDPGQFKGLSTAMRVRQLILSLRQKADATQPAVIASIGKGLAEDLRQLWLINAIAMTTDPATILRLARHPAVDTIRLDIAIPLADTTLNTAAPGEWNLSMINAETLWALGITGEGVVVANMDSGVDVNHPDLAGRWRGGSNSWYDPNGQHLQPYDAHGHGTQTMGLMVGGDQGGTAIGVAPGARWIAAKIFNDAGYAALSGIHLGFQWLIDPDGNPSTDDAPDVVNNSWGFNETVGDCYTEFATDIEILKTAGIAIVFAAGNSGPFENTSISPANNPGAFPVGSVDGGYTAAYTSSSGPNACSGGTYPEVMAPGVAVKTADLTLGGLVTDPFAYVSGTSFAAPHVTGAMALLLSANPALTPEELESALKQTVLDLGAPGPDNDYGHGLIDVAAAYNILGEPPACADADGDGYFATSGCGTPVDCNDADPAVYPGAPEIADDGIDQDCDGQDLISPACEDADGDGFFAGADCGSPVDCNDGDPSIHPGAAEVRFDGVDQDCNGYDLTIAIQLARYVAKRDQLEIYATSSLGAGANLRVNIPGLGDLALSWNARKARWEMIVKGASRQGLNPSDPGTATVSGLEGSVSQVIQKS